MRIASQMYLDGHFGSSYIPNFGIVEDLTKRNPIDFAFPFKDPSALDRVFPRTQEYGLHSFRDLSMELFDNLSLKKVHP